MRFLAQTALTLLANAIGIIIAALLLPGLHLNILGFTVSVIFFTGVEILFEPFILKMAIRYVPALRGGIALATTFIGLLLASIFTSGIEIRDLSTWILAPLVIWVTVVVMSIVLPMVLFKNILRNAQDGRQDKGSTR